MQILVGQCFLTSIYSKSPASEWAPQKWEKSSLSLLCLLHFKEICAKYVIIIIYIVFLVFDLMCCLWLMCKEKNKLYKYLKAKVSTSLQKMLSTILMWSSCCRLWQLVRWSEEFLGLHTSGLRQSSQQLHQQHREHGEHQQLASKGKSLGPLQQGSWYRKENKYLQLYGRRENISA